MRPMSFLLSTHWPKPHALIQRPGSQKVQFSPEPRRFITLGNSTNSHHNILNKYLVTDSLSFLRKSSWIFLTFFWILFYFSSWGPRDKMGLSHRIKNAFYFSICSTLFSLHYLFHSGDLWLVSSHLALTVLWKPETEPYTASDQHGKKHFLGFLSGACLVSLFSLADILTLVLLNSWAFLQDPHILPHLLSWTFNSRIY